MKINIYIFFWTLILFKPVFNQTATLERTLEIKTIDGTSVSFQNGIPVPSFEKQKRQTISLDGIWRKQRFTANHNLSLSHRDSNVYQQILTEALNRQLSGYNDADWDTISIPSVENRLNGREKCPEYYEDGVWYRYKFTLPDSLRNQYIKLMLYSVNYIADLWLNGKYLGYHEGGYTPFAFDVTPYAAFNDTNTLAVRVDNIPLGTRNDIVPYYTVDWFNYTGIIHDVYLEVSAPLTIARADVIPQKPTGEILTRVIIQNTTATTSTVQIKARIFKADLSSPDRASEFSYKLAGEEVFPQGDFQTTRSLNPSSVNVWKTTLTILQPELWNPKKPSLYILKIELSQNEQIIDEFYTQFGIRSVTVEGNKIMLNNQPIFLTGVARHEDSPVYGRSIPKTSIYNDLQYISEVNANYLRTAHYPNHPYTYLITDRLGIAVMEEIPVWWFDEEAPWIIQNEQRKIHYQMFREMVNRDMNRPSILLWSTCNECKNVPLRKAYIQTLKQDMQANFADGRLITQSAAADRPGAFDDSQNACDVAGWTMYYGIFYGKKYYQDTKNFLDSIPLFFPQKPVITTEFGFWSGEDRYYENQQMAVCNETFRALKERAALNTDGSSKPDGFLAGSTWWCIFDWYSHQHPKGYQSMGLYSMDRDYRKMVALSLWVNYLPYYSLTQPIKIEPLTISADKSQRIHFLCKSINPFSGSMLFQYELVTNGQVLLEIHNINGQVVGRLVDTFQTKGEYCLNWTADTLPSGIYLASLQIDKVKAVRKICLIK